MNMQKVKRAMKKIFCLPAVPSCLIIVPSFGLVIWALMNHNVHPAIAYTAYILSAYALIIAVTGAVRIYRWFRAGIGHVLYMRISDIPPVKKYLQDKMFRAEVSLYTGLLINLLYAGIKLFSGIRYHSIWFGTLSVYYILLAVMRFSLLHHVRLKEKRGSGLASELKRCRLCGMILMFLDWALVGIIILVVHKNSGFEYPGMLIYIMAMYTFYAVITAVMNVVRFKKIGSPVMSAAKVLNLTAALVSVLSLETAMLTQFGAAGDEVFRQMMSAATGAGVSVIVLGMAVYMMIETTKKLRGIQKAQDFRI